MKLGEHIRLIEKNRRLIDDFCEKNRYIYRFLPLERLLEILHNNQITFVSPTKWNDPFDNFLFKQEVDDSSFMNRLFVLCFTHNSHSQAYWKTYAPEGFGVRLSIRPKPFLDLLIKSSDKVWLGKMNYLYEKMLVQKLQGTPRLKSSINQNEPNDIFFNTFHLKRMPFKYEEESRISILTLKTREDGLRRIEINPAEIISQIYLDPRMGNHESKAWKEYLSKYKITVKKSLLFKEKNIKIN